jgi:hypothetical protein
MVEGDIDGNGDGDGNMDRVINVMGFVTKGVMSLSMATARQRQ